MIPRSVDSPPRSVHHGLGGPPPGPTFAIYINEEVE